MSATLIKVALPVPLRRLFDYRAHGERPPVGGRVKVPFGRQLLIGLVAEHCNQSEFSDQQLKPVTEIIDQSPVLSPQLWSLLQKTAHYYHHPLGETLATALPNAIMKGAAATLAPEQWWQITDAGILGLETLSTRAIRMQQVLRLLQQTKAPVADAELKANEVTAATLKSLEQKGWIESIISQPKPPQVSVGQTPTLNNEQATVVNQITQSLERFQPFLLEGITGSGKTEVYLQVIAKVIEQQQQALVLIPEIGLTPQTLQRFEQRFPGAVATIHSGMTDQQRLNSWLRARDGLCQVIIGTRSAIFTPFKKLGMIIVDEEHDLSFKQQDGLRYSSRDLAILRAQQEHLPVVLGSATPSLESLHNVELGRFQHLKLTERATGSTLPTIQLFDCKNQPMREGFSAPLLKVMNEHLKRDQQVLVFINRRGFAPVLLCHRCGWIADCRRCDAYLTLHQSSSREYLQCHHCGHYQNQPPHCPQCSATELLAIGQGTERIEQFLAQEFKDVPLQRIDRDTTRRKQAMSDYVKAAKSGETKLLIGTQMLAKGHHFPKVSLVVILDIDGALFSSDFRAQERAAQLITQVAGRAGRGDVEGQVVIQTHHPEHSLLQDLKHKSYSKLAQRLLAERDEAGLPPCSYLALFRAEAHNKQQGLDFLHQVRSLLEPFSERLEILGPVACTISRKAGRFRFQLIINGENRASLHRAVSQILPAIESSKLAAKVRWSLDIDAQDML